MIDKIEYLEEQMRVSHNVITEGLSCIHLCINVASNGNIDLIELLENGR